MARFPLEPGHSLGIRGKLLGQDLQCHIPVQLGIGGTIHHTHTPFADFLQNLVMANGRAVEKGRRGYGPRRIEETSYRADEIRYRKISAELLALLSELKCRKCKQCNQSQE